MSRPPDLDPVLASAVSLAVMLAAEATGESVTTCRAAVVRWVRHAQETGLGAEEIASRLTGRVVAGDEPTARRRWQKLVRQFGRPTITRGV